MTIYIVTSGIYSEYHIDEVFTDKEKAEMYCAVRNGDQKSYEDYNNYQVEVHECADDNVQGKIDVQYQFTVYEGSTEPPRRYDLIFKMSPWNENHILPKPFHARAIVYLTKNDPDLAFKIGKDMLAKYKAEQAGI